MPTLTETLHPGAFIVSEEEAYHCREAVIYAASQTIRPGMVLGAVTTAGVTKFQQLAPAAGDTSKDAAGIAVYPATTGVGGSAVAAALVRGPAQVRGSDLEWPVGITGPQKTAAVAQLLALGIVIR